MSHRPQRRFGQNFLEDQKIIANILQVFNPQTNDHVIEIGPGLGALTKPLLHVMPSLTAIEIDRDLHEHLQRFSGQHKLHLIKADALTVDYGQLGTGLRIIGNLPYNISTPLLFHLLSFRSSIKDMHFMLQKEVVDRLNATPGTKAYGRLTVMIQYQCKVEKLFEVPPDAFYPAPKVNSAVVRLVPYRVSPYLEVNVLQLENLVRQAFAMRRKTLENNLKSLLKKSDWEKLEIDPHLRPEQLAINDFVRIAQFLSN